MNRQLLFSYLFFFLFVPGLATSQGADTLNITLHRSFPTPPKINLTTIDMVSLESIPIGRVLHRATNQIVLEVVISRPQFASLEMDGAFLPLYLEPRHDLHLHIASADLTSILFKGHSAPANAYLSKANAIRVRAEQSAGKLYFNLPLPEFIAHLQATKKYYEQLDQLLLAKSGLADSLKEVLSGRNRVNLTFMQQNYVITHYGQQVNQVPDLLKASVQSPLFDPRFIRFNMPEYAFVTNAYVSYIVPGLLPDHQKTDESVSLLVDKFIRKGSYSLLEKEYFTAENGHNWLIREGITPTTDSLINQYKATFPHSTYLPALSKLYQKWSALAAGQPAPDFYGVTPVGDTLALSSLKGKVVYVDVWATWCVPCRAEFPQAKQLQEQFSGNPAVVFLYVSIDQNQAAWKKMLQEDPHPGGVHINQVSVEQAGSLWKPYLLSAIPRYMLINQKGLIVQANAHRPSSGKVAGAIQQLFP